MSRKKTALIAAAGCFVLYFVSYAHAPELGAVLFYASLALLVAAAVFHLSERAGARRRRELAAGADLEREQVEMFEDAGVEPGYEEDDHAPSGDDGTSAEIETGVMGPEMMVPEFDDDMGAFPFRLHELPTLTSVVRSPVSGTVFSTRRYYYLDAETLQDAMRCISALEFLIEQQTIAIGGIPPLKTDFRKLRAASTDDTEEQLERNTPWLSVNRRTPTGRAPKYPFSVTFDTWTGARDSLESNGDISFARDGSVGKARIFYRSKSAQYNCYFKVFDGSADLSVIDYQPIYGDTVTLYRHQ